MAVEVGSIKEIRSIMFGVIGCAVGASFAVLVAEELFALSCELLLSITSAGQLIALRNPPYFVLIEKALRDEGTSYHYLTPSDYSGIAEKLLEWLGLNLKSCSPPVEIGSTWTTDAPFRETASAIDAYRNMGLMAVEMEAAALYAFAKAKNKPVICFAHVTNQMASIEGDFEKGTENGSRDALRWVAKVAQLWKSRSKQQLNKPAES